MPDEVLMPDESPKKCECVCQRCINACRSRPGFFGVGEAEKAAELKGMTLQDFFDEFLVADFWADSSEAGDVWLLAPAVVGGPVGAEAASNPRGVCVFLQDDRCSIHAAKPAECSHAHHDLTDDQGMAFRRKVVDGWRPEEGQKQVETLLGRKPEAPGYSIFDLFNF